MLTEPGTIIAVFWTGTEACLHTMNSGFELSCALLISPCCTSASPKSIKWASPPYHSRNLSHPLVTRSASTYTRYEVLMVVKIQVEVFLVVALCSVIVYQRFRGPWRQQGPLKNWYLTTSLHGVTIQKTSTCIST